MPLGAIGTASFPEHLSSPPVFSRVRVTRYLVLYVCFVDRCLSFCTFSFGHCVDCSSSIYGFALYLWYLQTLLIIVQCSVSVRRVLLSILLYCMTSAYPECTLDFVFVDFVLLNV